MGNRNTKSSLRNAIIYLNISADSVGMYDDKFWGQIWSEDMSNAADVIKGISTQEIRMLRDGSPKNFASLTYKMVERLCLATGTLCNTHSQQTAVLNSIRILIRVIPCIFEDKAWRKFFSQNYIHTASSGQPRKEPEIFYPKKGEHEKNYKSYLPSGIQNARNLHDEIDEDFTAETNDKDVKLSNKTLPVDLSDEINLNFEPVNVSSSSSSGEPETGSRSLMRALILSICDLLFCPEFTVTPHTDNYLSSPIDAPPEDLKSLATCDYVWEPGVGFDTNINSTTYYDKSRSELLRLLLTCLSTTLYETPNGSVTSKNDWIEIFASTDNRHALPLFTSLLNTVFIYKTAKLLPFNHLLFEDTREELVELSIQILIATLDYQFNNDESSLSGSRQNTNNNDKKNLFIEYMSRIHRGEDFIFLIKGFTRLLNNCLEQSYVLNSTKHINFDQELLILFWKICNLNRKFVSYLLKSNDIINIVVPILYHLNENFQDLTKTALIHICVFNLLILSGERNFGVILNKPYAANSLTNLPAFTGSHADLMIIVFHKLILYGQNLHQLFDFLLTIIVNISPYLKALSMISSKCLIQLFEIFSSSSVVFTEPNYHQLVVFLLEIFNNLIQYQFDGNVNLVYAILNKKEAFLNLANLPASPSGIEKVINKLIKKKQRYRLIEKILIEQNTTSQDTEQHEASSHANNGQCCTQIGDYSTRTGATVSSNHLPSKPSPQSMKQEVSLVATPDICHVTHPIHPFEKDINPEIFFGEPVSFDDILNQNSEIPSHISMSSLSTETNNGQTTPALEDESQDPLSRVRDESTPAKKDSHKQVVDSKPTSSSDIIKKKWKPTPDWVKQWKQSLPLHTSLRMIEVLTPQLNRFKQGNMGQQDEAETIKFLQNGTLVGLLPVPHPILIRKYRTNNETTLWFRACTWGIIYVRNTIWTDTVIRLIKIV